nr:hypothetical protein [Halomonas sp. UBA3074]
MAISFNTEFYLEQKLAQLQENGETGFESTADVAAAFEAAGLTAEAHYEQYGLVEGLNPNEDFDTNVYLSQKLAQLQEDGEEFASVEDVIAAFAAAGLSPLEHYNQYGAAEALSPNAEFNVQAYLEDKLAQLQADGVEGFETTDDVLAAFQEAGLTPLDHFQQFGEEEGLVAQPLPTDTSALTEALAGLSGAKQDKADALVAALENEQVADQAPTNAETATDQQVDDALTLATTTVDNQLDAAVGTNVDFANAGNNTKAGLIADGRSAAEKTISDQQKVVADAEAEANAGVIAALDTVDSRLASYEAAIDAAKAANIAENGEEVKFETVNNVAVTEGAVNGVTTLEIGSTVVAKNINGKWTVEDTTTAETALEDLSGFDTYLASLQAETDAANAEIDAKASLKSAIAQVIALENEDDSITADDVSDSVIGADTSAADKPAEVALDLTANAPVIPDAPTVVETTTGTTGTPGTLGTPEVNTVEFVSLADGESASVAGLTLTANGGALTATQVANAFADSSVAVANGDFTGTLSGEWIVNGSGGTSVSYQSTLAGNVPAITTNNTGTVTETTPGVAPTPGTPGTNEVQTVTFESLVAGQQVTIDGATLTAAADLTADQVAGAFADLAGVDAAAGTVTGSLNSFSAGTANGAELAFTATSDGDKALITPTVSANANGVTSETAPEAQGILNERVVLAADEKALTDLNEAISEWEALVALDGKLGDLDEAVVAAEKAITDSEEDGGLGVTLLNGDDNFTAESDVYLFEEGTNQQLSGFGANGEDKIYFGEGYVLAQIEDGKTINNNVGDAAAQEILWQQDGNNLVLFVEEETFAGNSSAGASADITTITLTGVSADDVNLENGFLTSGTVEVA